MVFLIYMNAPKLPIVLEALFNVGLYGSGYMCMATNSGFDDSVFSAMASNSKVDAVAQYMFLSRRNIDTTQVRVCRPVQVGSQLCLCVCDYHGFV